MTAAVDLFEGRSKREEGDLAFMYNDAVGRKRFTGKSLNPPGNISIGRGINLENGIDAVEDEFLFRHRCEVLETSLLRYPWYANAPAIAQSVALDVAYNEGLGGLLHFPHMIGCFATKDWAGAAHDLHVQNESLDTSRYAPLRQILQSLVSAAAGPSGK